MVLDDPMQLVAPSFGYTRFGKSTAAFTRLANAFVTLCGDTSWRIAERGGCSRITGLPSCNLPERLHFPERVT
jgi:hypothetical protein